MSDPDERWQRVGAAISKRIDSLGLTKAEVIRASGVSAKSLDGYLAGNPIVRSDKARDLCRALGWTINSIDLVLDGQEPQLSWPGDDDPAGATPPLTLAAYGGKLNEEQRARVAAFIEGMLSR